MWDLAFPLGTFRVPGCGALLAVSHTLQPHTHVRGSLARRWGGAPCWMGLRLRSISWNPGRQKRPCMMELSQQLFWPPLRMPGVAAVSVAAAGAGAPCAGPICSGAAHSTLNDLERTPCRHKKPNTYLLMAGEAVHVLQQQFRDGCMCCALQVEQQARVGLGLAR